MVCSSSSCSGDRKVKTDTTATKVSPASASGEATSCLSTTSSARSLRYAKRGRSASATENGIQRKTPLPVVKNRVKPVIGTPHLRRRGEAIMKFLSHGISSEVRIREMLGDSPDTSKALRMWYSIALSFSHTYARTHIGKIGVYFDFSKFRGKFWLYLWNRDSKLMCAGCLGLMLWKDQVRAGVTIPLFIRYVYMFIYCLLTKVSIWFFIV